MLIAAGADPLARDAQDNMPLHFRPIAALLGPGVNVRNRAGLTPLHRAALDGDEKALRWLLEQGADPSLETTGAFEHREGVLAPEFDPVHRFAPGLRAYDLAKWQHDRTEWSTGRFRSIVVRLDAVTPRRSLLRRWPDGRRERITDRAALAPDRRVGGVRLPADRRRWDRRLAGRDRSRVGRGGRDRADASARACRRAGAASRSRRPAVRREALRLSAVRPGAGIRRGRRRRASPRRPGRPR